MGGKSASLYAIGAKVLGCEDWVNYFRVGTVLSPYLLVERLV
jgi:hypothetical protein